MSDNEDARPEQWADGSLPPDENPNTESTGGEAQADRDTIRDAGIDHPDSERTSYRPLPPKEWQLGEALTFGKHQGKTIQQVIFEDIGWMTWALRDIKNFTLASSAKEHYNRMLEKKGTKWE